MIYLASPYSHPDPQIMHNRFKTTERVTAQILRNRIWVYSPIVHCHALAQEYDLPKDFEFWKDYNYHMLSKATELWILQLLDWDASKGVTAELELARLIQIPIRYWEPEAWLA